MRLGIQMLSNSSTLNNLALLNSVTITPGEILDVYFELVDLDKQLVDNFYQRYIPQAGSTLSVQFFSNNNIGNLTKPAIQPFALDNSIFTISLTANDTGVIQGANMKVTLTEGATVKIAWGHNVINVLPTTPFAC